MQEQPNIQNSSLIYYRLIALWVLCEAMLGGIIHGLRIPVSGLFVGSCAIICISLIAWYVPGRGAILKATLIVAIFKMILSPHASLPAYFAVFFQGALGELLFRNLRSYRLACMLLAILGLIESGIQRILVLTLIYGNDAWVVINDLINGLLKQRTKENYVLWLGGAYVAIHLFTGMLVGWWAGGLPHRIKQWSREKIITSTEIEDEINSPIRERRRHRFKKGLFVAWIILIGLYIQSYFNIGEPILPSYIALKILLRSLIIVLSWVFVLGPLLRILLHDWLKKKQGGAQQEMQQVLALIPATKTLIMRSWRSTSDHKGLKRLKTFSRIVLVNTVSPEARGSYIFTGEKGVGKSTALMNWSANKPDVWGIITPVVDGKKVFMNANTHEQFPMEAVAGETETIEVGRFVFSKKNFQKAEIIIRDAITRDGWLILDEIGPLELRGEGFAAILREVINKRKEPLLLVIREGLTEKVKAQFNLIEVVTITTTESLDPARNTIVTT